MGKYIDEFGGLADTNPSAGKSSGASAAWAAGQAAEQARLTCESWSIAGKAAATTGIPLEDAVAKQASLPGYNEAANTCFVSGYNSVAGKGGGGSGGDINKDSSSGSSTWLIVGALALGGLGIYALTRK